MSVNNDGWLTMKEAARHYGYSSSRSLSRRISQLRKRGRVMDIGYPSAKYPMTGEGVVSEDKIILRWLHSQTVLLRADAPAALLNPRKGRRRVG